MVRSLLEGFARRDHERAFDFYDANIEWDASAGVELNSDLLLGAGQTLEITIS